MIALNVRKGFNQVGLGGRPPSAVPRGVLQEYGAHEVLIR